MMTRALVGTITGGTNLSFSYTAWTYNKYILYPSYHTYYQLGPHTSSILNNPPYGQWNPAPQNDPYQTGGRRGLPGNSAGVAPSSRRKNLYRCAKITLVT